MVKENTAPAEEIEEETVEEAVTEETAAEVAEVPAEEENGKKKEHGERNRRKKELEVKIQELEEALAKQKDQLLRTAAEYENYRKRTEREKAAIYNDAVTATIAEILPVEDNLERALAQPDCSAEDMRKGVEMVQNQMNSCLQKLGVTAMGEVGDPFDPAVHNAVMHIDDESLGENVISMVLQKGYKMGDKIVRHAMVQVAN